MLKISSSVSSLTDRGIEFKNIVLNSGIHTDDENCINLDGIIRFADLDKDHGLDLRIDLVVVDLQSNP